MDVNNNSNNFSDVRSRQLKRISQLAVGSVLVVAIALAVVLLFLSDESGMDYAHLLQSHRMTQQHLLSGLIVGGLFLTLCIGLISWLLMLVGSHHVAGPLFRIRRNLEQASSLEKPHPIRNRDCFQNVYAQLEQALGALHSHYSDVGGMLNQFEAALESGDEEEASRLINQIKGQLDRVRLD
jgi:hypothetical protein